MAPKKNFTQVALDVVRRATGEVAAPAPKRRPKGERRSVATKRSPAKKKAGR
jgi:hypothetical protein